MLRMLQREMGMGVSVPVSTSTPRRSGCRLWTIRALPFPAHVSHLTASANVVAHHLQGVEFFLDLLSQHRRQAVAGRNLTTSVVFPTWPGVMKLESGAERYVSNKGLGCHGVAL